MRIPSLPFRKAHIIVLSLFIFLFIRQSDATEFTYHWGHPSPQGNIVYNMAFADANNGWAVTGCGQVLETSDGGQNWELTMGPDPDNIDLYDIVISGQGTLIVSGDSGRIMRSTDTGVSFQTQAFQGAGRLFDLCLIPGGGISAAGQNGVVLVSFDDGITWTDKGPGGTGYARCHLWKSATEGYVVGMEEFYRTTNGGNSWTVIDTPPMFGLNEIFFVNNTTGYAIADFGYWKTTNGGQTWIYTDVFSGLLYHYRTVVIDDQHWFAVAYGEGGELWETTDGGQNWNNLMYYQCTGFPCLVRIGNRLLFGSDIGDLFYTDDSGITVTNATQNLAVYQSAPITVIGSRPDGTLFCNNQPSSGTDNGTFLRSDDGGYTWYIPENLPGLRWVNDIEFGDNQHGLLGSYSDIRYTSDGGESWGESTLPDNYNVFSFALPSPGNYFAGAFSSSPFGGNLFHSTDGGATWTIVSNGLPVNELYVTSVDFADVTHGFVTGLFNNLAAIYSTSDGGQSWTKVDQTDITSYIGDMEWLDENTGIAAVPNSDNGIYRTVDGGKHWTKVSENGARHLTRYQDDRIGALDTYSTFFQESTDDGLSWTSYSPPFSSNTPGFTGTVESIQATEDGYIIGGAGNRLLVADAGIINSIPQANNPSSPNSLSVIPNPVNEHSVIRIELKIGAYVTLRLYDAQGRMICQYLDSYLDKGIYELPVGNAFTSITPGVYLMKMEAGKQSISYKVIF